MSEIKPALQIIAQPEPIFRERYICEKGPNGGNQRFQHAVRGSGFIYPTLALSRNWANIATHVRVMLVTVPQNDTIPTYIHPFPISNDDPTILKDEQMNALYFPISPEEFNREQKEFQIAQHRLPHEALKEQCPLRRYETNQVDEISSEIVDPKKLMQTFRLKHSKLFFCFAKVEEGNQNPTVFLASGVFSHERFGTTAPSKINSTDCDFAPDRCDFRGGVNVLMTIKNIDRRRGPILQFSLDVVSPVQHIPFKFINRNTLKFVAPPCPIEIPEGLSQIDVPIVMMQSGSEISRIDFIYQKTSTCPKCGASLDGVEQNDDDSPMDDWDDSRSYQSLLEPTTCQTPEFCPPNCDTSDSSTTFSQSTTDPKTRPSGEYIDDVFS